MNYYNNVPHNQINAEKKYIISAIFKLIPYKEESYKYLDNYFESVLQRLYGLNKVFGYPPEMLTIISLVEYARTENNYPRYRKSILDACGLVDSIKESEGDVK